MSGLVGPNDVTSNLLLSLDLANSKNYNGKLTVVDSIGKIVFTNSSGTYATATNGTLQFVRSASTNTGAGLLSPAMTGSLAVSNFYYNDHTLEIWARLDNVNPPNWDNTQNESALVLYYSSSTLAYTMYSGTVTSVNCANWTVGISGNQINQGNWYQIAVTRSVNTFTAYINGQISGTGLTVVTTATGIPTSNTLVIGAANQTPQTQYAWYANMTFGNLKMYNRALSALEINQNFNAMRGRFGI